MKLPSVRIFSYSVIGWGFAVPAALLGVWASRTLHLADLSAAWITFGLFGLAGGAGFVLPIRAAGGKAGVAHAMILSGIWTPCLVASVVPLFFTMGLPAKMAALSLFSFSLFGSIGGLATAWLLDEAFSGRHRRDLLPSAACWGFGFGAAAATMGFGGAVLSTVLPAYAARPLGFGAMAAAAGIVGGCALVVFLKTADSPPDLREPVRRIGGPGLALALWTALLLAPFYVNDLADLWIADWRLWLIADYTAVKFLPLAVFAWLIHTRRTTLPALGLTGIGPAVFAAAFYAALLFGTFIDQNAVLLIGRIPGHTRLGGMPVISHPLAARMDLTLGLMMTAVCEELVFRGYLYALFRRFTRSDLAIVIVSAAAFGLIHWSGGMHRVAAAALIGAVFMAIYIRTRSLHPLILAHFLINYIHFSGVFPTDILKYM